MNQIPDFIDKAIVIFQKTACLWRKNKHGDALALYDLHRHNIERSIKTCIEKPMKGWVVNAIWELIYPIPGKEIIIQRRWDPKFYAASCQCCN